MITIKALTKKHRDDINITQGYAFGYSYITRKSKLNAAIELLTILTLSRNLFCFSYYGRDLEYIKTIPYYLLIRDFMMIFENIHLIRACVDDKKNDLFYTIADIFTWTSYTLIGFFFSEKLWLFTLTLVIRLIADFCILSRYVYIMKENSSDTIFQTTGHGIIWSSFYLIYWLWLVNFFKISFRFTMISIYLYIIFLLGTSIVLFIQNKFYWPVDFSSKQTGLILIEISVYALMEGSLITFGEFVDKRHNNFLSMGIISLFFGVGYLMFYSAVLVAGEIVKGEEGSEDKGLDEDIDEVKNLVDDDNEDFMYEKLKSEKESILEI